MTQTKLCRSCETVKPLSDFYIKDRYNIVLSQRHQSRCKPCQKKNKRLTANQVRAEWVRKQREAIQIARGC